MILFYRLFLLLYHLGIRITSLWKPKARAWLNGRRGQWARLRAGVPGRQPGRKRFWIHCASLGEFEQGRPVIEAIRRDWPGAVVVLSFFSPSGYEIRKDYELADVVCYLPMDGPSNARRFAGVTDPDAVLFVKYEFWHYYLKTLEARAVPAILVSGAFRESQPFFKHWGGFFRDILKRFSVLTVQDERSLKLLQGIGLGNRALISGDTRYDRVLGIVQQASDIPEAALFREGAAHLLVAGSTWPKDEELLASSWNRFPAGTKLILAPHELGESHLCDIEARFSSTASTLRFSRAGTNRTDADVLIIDNIGMLSGLYRYGDIAYIGGGFNSGGIHNVLEPAVFGLPVIMGPVFQKFNEAVEMVHAGFAFPVENEAELVHELAGLVRDASRLEELRTAIRQFVKSKGGATARVMEVLRKAF